jgi:hypothetical protein
MRAICLLVSGAVNTIERLAGANNTRLASTHSPQSNTHDM